MAKKVSAYIKLQIPAGKANPAPPVGPALGQNGVNIMEFCKQFNAATQKLEPGLPTPVVITVYSDRSFTFITKTPRAAPTPTPRRSARSPRRRLKKSPSRKCRTSMQVLWKRRA